MVLSCDNWLARAECLSSGTRDQGLVVAGIARRNRGPTRASCPSPARAIAEELADNPGEDVGGLPGVAALHREVVLGSHDPAREPVTRVLVQLWLLDAIVQEVHYASSSSSVSGRDIGGPAVQVNLASGSDISFFDQFLLLMMYVVNCQ